MVVRLLIGLLELVKTKGDLLMATPTAAAAAAAASTEEESAITVADNTGPVAAVTSSILLVDEPTAAATAATSITTSITPATAATTTTTANGEQEKEQEKEVKQEFERLERLGRRRRGWQAHLRFLHDLPPTPENSAAIKSHIERALSAALRGSSVSGASAVRLLKIKEQRSSSHSAANKTSGKGSSSSSSISSSSATWLETNASKFFGVSWDKSHQKWVAKVLMNESEVVLGSFFDEAEAARKYDEHVGKEKLGRSLNFPDGNGGGGASGVGSAAATLATFAAVTTTTTADVRHRHGGREEQQGSLAALARRRISATADPGDSLECEHCGTLHDGSYGTGRFCDRRCQNGFSGSHNAGSGLRGGGGEGGGGGGKSSRRRLKDQRKQQQQQQLDSDVGVAPGTSSDPLLALALSTSASGLVVSGNGNNGSSSSANLSSNINSVRRAVGAWGSQVLARSGAEHDANRPPRLAWLHGTSTAVLAELSLALSLWHPRQPQASRAVALCALDVYGSWDLEEARPHAHHAALFRSPSRATAASEDLSFEDMEVYETVVSRTDDFGGGGGGGGLSTRSSSSKRRRGGGGGGSSGIDGKETKVPWYAVSTEKRPPLWEHISLGGGDKRGPNGFPTQVKKDFGAPFGVYVGAVAKYVPPYYTIAYEDGDSEEMTPKQVMGCRLVFARGLDQKAFGGESRRQVVLRLGRGKAGSSGGGAPAGAQYDCLDELPPLFKPPLVEEGGEELMAAPVVVDAAEASVGEAPPAGELSAPMAD
jgi:hypothetical protein